eukprot:460828-Rhodomonas_salina.1
MDTWTHRHMDTWTYRYKDLVCVSEMGLGRVKADAGVAGTAGAQMCAWLICVCAILLWGVAPLSLALNGPTGLASMTARRHIDPRCELLRP